MKRILILTTLLFISIAAFSREQYPLNEGWRFFFQYENGAENSRVISLPHTWNMDARGTNGNYLRTTANYINSVYIPQKWSARRQFIHFDGVATHASLFVNGAYVGSHSGAGTAFTFEITSQLKYGAENQVMVVVNNALNDYILPTSSQMNTYGGIYRTVELISTPKVAISPLYFGAEGVLVHTTSANATSARGDVELHISSPTQGSQAAVDLEIVDSRNKVVFSKNVKVKVNNAAPVIVPFSVQSPMLWSPATPSLYTVRATLMAGDDVDRVEVKTGFREIDYSDPKHLKINDVATLVKGVNLYHDNITVGGAMSDFDVEQDFVQIQQLGANAIRSVGQPHLQSLYEKCDSEGVMVWIDSPFTRAPYYGDISYYATPAFEQNGMDQLREIVLQNINHPSVVMWGIFSHIWSKGNDPLDYIKRLNTMVKDLDRTRPTVACSDQDGDINFVTDLIVWNQNVGWNRGSTDDVVLWQDVLRKDWGSLRSAICYGEEGFVGQVFGSASSSLNPNSLPESKQTEFHDAYAKNVDLNTLFWGVWIDCMFDFGSARSSYGVDGSGLVSYDRRQRKDSYYLYRSMWNESAPTLHITGKRKFVRDAGLQKIKIYSSAGAPQLLVNGDTIALKQYAPTQFVADSIAVDGRAKVEARVGDLIDSCTFIVGNRLKPRNLPILRTSIDLKKIN